MNWYKFGRFSLVGVVGAALQLCLLWALTTCFNLSTLLTTPIAVELTMLHNFAWHERFTWSERRRTSTHERFAGLLRFHAGNGIVSLFGNTLLNYSLVQCFQVPVVVAGFLAITACSLLNFAIADRWVFSHGYPRYGSKVRSQ